MTKKTAEKLALTLARKAAFLQSPETGPASLDEYDDIAQLTELFTKLRQYDPRLIAMHFKQECELIRNSKTGG